jgi:hypothetical protein
MQAAHAQKQRHDEVVADHGRQCNRLDDDHPGGGREAPDEDHQREYGLLFLHRYREHEGVGIDASAREQQQPGERDGQHEYVDEQEVQREQPHRFPEVALVDVLHYQHLELPRQNDDGTHGKQRQRDPTGVTCDAVDGEKSAQRAGGFCLRENLAESAIETERHEQADSQKRDELDDRLEGYGGHHAFMLLAGIDMARSEQDREQRHDQGDVKPGVLQEMRARRGARHRDLGILQQQRKAGRYRFELQRDVGKDTDHRDDGHKTAELKALAVSRRDEIRDRGGAVDLADTDDLADHEPGHDEGERRPEVDRQEVDAGRRSPPDGAVECPGRAVDCNR